MRGKQLNVTLNVIEKKLVETKNNLASRVLQSKEFARGENSPIESNKMENNVLPMKQNAS